MSDKRKGGRPKKVNYEKPYPLAITRPDDDSDSDKYKKHVLSSLTVDPCSEHNEILWIVTRSGTKEVLNIYVKKWVAHSHVMTGIATEKQKQIAADEYIENLASMTAEQMKDFFNVILAYKEQIAMGRSRIFFAVQACYDYMEEAGKQPSKPQLKRFILARKDIYADTPSENVKSEWTRLWKEAGLDGLANR